jgi:hypothetical protein
MVAWGNMNFNSIIGASEGFTWGETLTVLIGYLFTTNFSVKISSLYFTRTK